MIISTLNRITHKGNGTAKIFPFPFNIIEKSHLNIYLVGADGQEKRITSDYFVDEVLGAVLYPGYPPGQEPPENKQPPILPLGSSLIIYREVPITQETDFGTRHPMPQIEEGDDKLTMIAQQLQESLSRKFGVPVSVPYFDFTMPTPLVGGAVLAVKDDLSGLEYGPTETDLNNAITIANDAKTIANSSLSKSETAISTANNALGKSTIATTTSNEAKTIANEAKTLATTANTNASEAKALSSTADTNANNAVSIANSAKATADGISSTANTALANSQTAITTANSAKATADGVDAKATEALSLATDASNKVNSFDTRITTNATNISSLTTRTTSLETIATQHEAEATAKWVILNNVENKVNSINGVPSFDSTDANKVLLVSSTGASMGWESFHTIRIWKPSTAVVVGQIMYPTSATSPLAYECIKSGTTGTAEPTGKVMQAVTDGTARWGIFDVRFGRHEVDGNIILKNWLYPPIGWRVANGASLSNSMTYFPLLHAAFESNIISALNATDWALISNANNNGIGGVPYFKKDYEKIIGLPDARDMYFRASGTHEVSTYHGDAIRNIKGVTKPNSAWVSLASNSGYTTGAFYPTDTSGGYPTTGGSVTTLSSGLGIDVSLVVPVAEENRVKSIVYNPFVFVGYEG